MIAALADVGAAMEPPPVAFRQRFVRDPAGSAATVADRRYNLQQSADAFLRYDAVRSVEYDFAADPTRLTVTFVTPRTRRDAATPRESSPSPSSPGGGAAEGASARPADVDTRRADLFINNRGSQELGGAGGGDFVAFELYRQLTNSAKQSYVSDYMTISRYSRQQGADDAPSSGSGDGVNVVQRVAAFLQPQDRLYFQVGADAIALYDYTFEMRRAVD